MTQTRETIRKALLELVARRDPAVFQNADVFQKQLQQIGQWPDLPEISALKAGLIERFPWELQKDPDRIVNEKSVVALAGTLTKKHRIENKTALWAVETWGVSLGLQVVMPAEKPKGATVNTPTTLKKETAFDGPEFSNTRLGVVFGTDEAGLIRVYKSWFGNAPQNETAGLTATTVKIETPKSVPLFTAAPKPRQPKTTTRKPIPQPSSSPAMVKQAQPEPAMKKPAAASVPTSPAEPAQPMSEADTLLARANTLLPGGSGRLDIREALGLLQLAVKKGSIRARRRFGEIYLKGIGVNPNLPNAASWFKTAAELGDAESQFQLGSLFQCGVGVEYNLEMAQIWLQRAADQGHNGAAELLKQIS